MLLWLASAPAYERVSALLLLALTACSPAYAVSVSTNGPMQTVQAFTYVNKSTGSKGGATACAAGVKCVSDVQGSATALLKLLTIDVLLTINFLVQSHSQHKRRRMQGYGMATRQN
jgi:hypothetical protein